MRQYLKTATAGYLFLTVMLCLLLATPTLSVADKGEDGCEVFSEIEIRELLTQGCSVPGKSWFQTMTGSDQRHYLLTFGKDQDKPEFGCVVQIAKGGSLLSPKHYAERYAAEQQQQADRGQSYLDSRFPSIGSRAIMEASGFGPGGGGHSLTFTTTDECCDIRVEAGGQLSGRQQETIDLQGLAKSLSDAYDMKMKTNSPSNSK